jgi:hypothetical protein
VVATGLGPTALLLPLVSECRLGSPVATDTIWSPVFLVNVPEGGSVATNVSYTPVPSTWDGNYTMTSGSLTVGVLPRGPGLDSSGAFESTSGDVGGIFAGYKEINWTFFRAENVSARDPTPGPCTQPFVAEGWFAAPFGCGGTELIPLANNSTDALEPHVWNATGDPIGSGGSNCPSATPGTYVWFIARFFRGFLLESLRAIGQ